MLRLLIPAFAVVFAAVFAFGAVRLTPQSAGAVTNLVANGTFDTDVGGWTAEDANIVLSFSSTEGMPAGSAQVDSVQFPPITSAIQQCVAASPNTFYGVSADALNGDAINIASPPPSDATAQLVVELFSDSACATSIDSVAFTPWAPNDVWETRAGTFESTANTGSALIRLVFTGGTYCGNGRTVFFDNVSFAVQPPATAAAVRSPRTHTPTRTVTAAPSSTPMPATAVAAPATTVPAPQPTEFSGEGGVRAGGISPPSTGSGYGVFGPSRPLAQASPNVC